MPDQNRGPVTVYIESTDSANKILSQPTSSSDSGDDSTPSNSSGNELVRPVVSSAKYGKVNQRLPKVTKCESGVLNELTIVTDDSVTTSGSNDNGQLLVEIVTLNRALIAAKEGNLKLLQASCSPKMC